MRKNKEVEKVKWLERNQMNNTKQDEIKKMTEVLYSLSKNGKSYETFFYSECEKLAEQLFKRGIRFVRINEEIVGGK